jgi:ABC-type multidrug transport system fused ATPase/permease subunit
MTNQLHEMRRSLREARNSIRASPGFATSVLITLGLAGLIGLMTLLMSFLGGFLGMAHFTEPAHRIHDLTYGFLFTTAVIGLLAQLRRPSENVAGMLMALMPWVGLLLVAVLSSDPGVILSAERMLVAAGTVIAVLLHPARHGFFRSFTVPRINWVMLGLVLIAAVPLVAFASTNVGLQRNLTNEHAAMGHYGFLAAFGFTVIGSGVLASLRPDGWRLTAWVAGLLPAVLGLASVVYPDVDSSLNAVWAVAAIGWGVVFVATAERTRHAGA